MKENFTADEWKNLVALPYAISMAVIAAAPNMMGLWSETKSMMQEPQNLAASSGSALAGLIIAEAQPQSRNWSPGSSTSGKRTRPDIGPGSSPPAHPLLLPSARSPRKRPWPIRNGSLPSA